MTGSLHHRRALRRAALAGLVVLGLASPLSAQPLPQYDGQVHGGNANCAGAPCHGHTTKSDKRVRLNEVSTWMRYDQHAGAYNLLFNADSKRMAKNLGLEEGAHNAKICLDCHADNTAKDKRGKRFSLEEGVQCEACHGGSGRYVQAHAAGLSHRKNLELGLYPTDDPVKRAELCLSCHFGTKQKFVNHRLMGAGHPRQRFEVAVFTETQPRHYDIDADYVARGKQAPDRLKVWAIGQAVAARHVLDALLDPEMNHQGLWPEFVLYDCHACHHPWKAERWRPRPSVDLEPGLARLNDSSFLMLRHSMQLIDAARVEAFRQDVRALHQASSKGVGDQQAIAKRLRANVVGMIPELEAWKVDDDAYRELARSVLDEGISGEYVDYAAAEQMYMALQVIVMGFYDRSAYDKQILARLSGEVKALGAATKDQDAYEPTRVEKSLKRMRAAIDEAG